MLLATVTDTTWTGAAGVPSWYQIVPLDIHGNTGTAARVLPQGSLDVPAAAPPAFAFDPPSPNPSRGETALTFTLARDGAATLVIHDAQGRVVRTLTAGMLAAGPHELPWDGRDSRGRAAPPGLYFARLTCADHTVTHRLLRLP